MSDNKLQTAVEELLQSFYDTDDGQIGVNVDQDGIFNFPDDVRRVRAALRASATDEEPTCPEPYCVLPASHVMHSNRARPAVPEALDVEALRAEFEAMPFTRRWPNMKYPGEWYVRLDDAVSMVEERVREAYDGGRQARSSAARQPYIGPIQHSDSMCQQTTCDCWCRPCERHNWRHARPAVPETLDVERLAKAIHDDRCVDPTKHSEESHAGKDPDTQEEAARVLRWVDAALRSKEPT